MVQKRLSARKPKRPRKSESPTQEKDIADAIAYLDKLEKDVPRARQLAELLKSWLKDDSGYDEVAWPELRRALNEERRRVGARRLFRG